MIDTLYFLCLCIILLAGAFIGAVTYSKRAWALLGISFAAKASLAILITFEPIFGSGDIVDYGRHISAYLESASLIDYLSPLGGGPQVYIGLYPGFLYETFGDPAYLLIRLINAVFAVLAEATLYLLVLRLTQRKANLKIFAFTFMWPSWLRYSIELGRTSLTVVAVLVSLLFIVKLFQTGNRFFYFFCFIASLGFCLLIRPPYVTIPLIFFSAYLFSRLPSQTQLQRMKRTATYFLVVSALGTTSIILYNSVARPLQRVDVSALIERSQRNVDAGSVYLSSISFNSLIDTLLYAPLFGFFFLFSPMPWQLQQNPFVVGSIIQATFTFFLVLIACRRYLLFGKKGPPMFDKGALFSVLIAILGSAFIFGLGVTVAGAAERYRMPLTLMVITFALYILTECPRASFRAVRNIRQ